MGTSFVFYFLFPKVICDVLKIFRFYAEDFKCSFNILLFDL